MTAPNNYLEGVPRVSNLVEFMFPFEGDDEGFFIRWLEKNNIDRDEYMAHACDIGTLVHSSIEEHIKHGTQYEGEKYKNTIQGGISFYEEHLKGKYEIETEKYILDKDGYFQGTSDIFGINEEKKEIIIVDWKSWGIAKGEYGIEDKYKKPYGKLKKVSAQLSFYANNYREYNIKLFCVYLREDKTYFYEVPLLSEDDINSIIEGYKKSLNGELLIIPNNENTMKVILQSPTHQQYELIRFEQDVEKGTNMAEVFSYMNNAKKAFLNELKK